MIEWIDKPMAELTREEFYGEKAKLLTYHNEWPERKQYLKLLDEVSLEPDLPENEMLNFKYLQAIYMLNTFFDCHIKPAAYFETRDEKICAEIIEQGGTIPDMYRAGADALYCALLSDSRMDKEIMLKTVDRHIPF
jgi:hypothetical protein